MRRQQPLADRVAAVSALDDPVRLALLDLVAHSESALSRDQAAQALGVTRRTAAFHLDRLAHEGLLAVEMFLGPDQIARRSGADMPPIQIGPLRTAKRRTRSANHENFA